MPVITVFSATYCPVEDVARGVAERLGLKRIEKKLIQETSRRWHAAEEKLLRAMHGPPPLLGNFRRERSKYCAYLTATFAELIQPDNILYHGFATHLLPRTIAHILRVLIVANQDYRVEQAMKSEGITPKEALRKIRKDDEERAQWTEFLYEKPPYSEDLYDIIIPMQTSTVEEAVDLICENAHKDAVRTTPESLQVLEDFLLAAKVHIALIEKGHDELEVTAVDGTVTVGINKSVAMLEHYMEKVREIAAAVPGVKEVHAKVGSKYRTPSIISSVEFELPRKVLLVDDEKEFVHTLSERLQTRDLESTVVYNGEEALSQIETDEPEVMVLDLKMPGIDGLQVLRRVKKEHPDVEVIILTGHGSKKEEALAKELGAFAYLNKPVDIDVLAQTMKEAYRKIAEKKASRE
jgi:CheY-like chemotaxis protein/cytidylate kinase